MTHDKLLAKLWEEIKHCGCDDGMGANCHQDDNKPWNALRAVVELHKPEHSIRGYRCTFDDEEFPCRHHQAIEKELK